MNLKRLKDHVSHGLTLRVTLRDPSCRNVYGFPVVTSGALLVMHEIYEYRPWGWVAVPWGNVASFRSGRFERFSERVLAGEGVTARPCPSWVDASSVAALMTSLMQRRRNVVVETADVAARSAAGERCFYLGRVLSVDASRVSMRTVSALARWDRRATRVGLANITVVRFDDPYTRTFSKYAAYPEGDEPAAKRGDPHQPTSARDPSLRARR